MARNKPVIWVRRKQKSFCKWDWTAKSLICPRAVFARRLDCNRRSVKSHLRRKTEHKTFVARCSPAITKKENRHETHHHRSCDSVCAVQHICARAGRRRRGWLSWRFHYRWRVDERQRNWHHDRRHDRYDGNGIWKHRRSGGTEPKQHHESVRKYAGSQCLAQRIDVGADRSRNRPLIQ